jgi:hypothetical protein
VVGLTLEGEWDSVLNTIRLRNSAGRLHVEPAGDSHTNYFTSTTHVAIIQPDPIDGRLAQPFGRLLTTGCQQQIGLPGILVAERMCRELRSPDDLTPLAIESLSLDLLTSYIRARRSRMGSAPPWLSRTVDLHARALSRSARSRGTRSCSGSDSRASRPRVSAAISYGARAVHPATPFRIGGAALEE